MPEYTDHTTDPAVELSVVIPAYNAADSIGAQLDALRPQVWSGSWEVVVADNGSTDGTASLVQTISAADTRVRFLDASQHPGAAHARNCGVGAARGRFIAFCDADDVVTDGWLAAIGDALRLSPFVTGPQEIEQLNPPWLHGIYGTVPARRLQMFAGVFPFGPGANLGIHRDLFERVGRFDPSLEAGEDLDLCLRVWLSGVELTYVPRAVVHYRYRQDLGALWRQALSYGTVQPAIARSLAIHGRPTPSRWRGSRNWIWLMRRLPALRSRAGRARWVVVAGGCVGRLISSVRHRHLVL